MCLFQVSFASQHLLRLITDILDFSKIEAGKLQMEEVQFSLYDQLEHAVSVLAARALQSGLELCCCIASDVPDQIKGDPGRLLQIFVNLIGRLTLTLLYIFLVYVPYNYIYSLQMSVCVEIHMYIQIYKYRT